METQLQELKQAAVSNFIKRWGHEKAENFADKFSFKMGKKYIKVIHDGSAWAFIVTKDGEGYRKGDILKASSWSAPAKNSPRGNIIDGGYRVEWTGPLYLR